jgi:formate/nitrite transporter FocA (FNT family)
MANDDKKPKKKLDSSIVSKKMLAIAFMAPSVLSISFMAIAFFATLNASDTVQMIFLVVATFLGLGLSIVIIFLMQKRINKKIR